MGKKNKFLQKKIDAAEKACKDCTTEAFRRPDVMNAVAKKIAATLVRVHQADKYRQLIARGTGKHRQNANGPENFTKLMDMIKQHAEAKIHSRRGKKQFDRVFSGKLLTGAREALFGSTSVCDLLGPQVIKMEGITTILSVESGRGSTQYGFWKKNAATRRRMAQREFSSRRDSPVMVRLL